MVSLLLAFTLAYPNPDAVPLLETAMRLTFQENYAAAEVVLDSIIRRWPQDPAGYLFKAGMLDLYMLDFSTRRREKEFYGMCDAAVRRADRLLREASDPRIRAWAHFFKGSALSYKALRQGRNRSFFSALRNGLAAVRELSQAVKLDSTLYDAYLGLGIYDYAMAELPRYLKWLPFVKDGKERREKALREMRLAAEQGWFSRVPAKDALAWTLAYRGRAREGYRIAMELVREFPESRSFRWTAAFAARRAGLLRRAEELYEEILYLVYRDQRGCNYCAAITLYWLAVTERARRKWEEARDHALLALSHLEDSTHPKRDWLRKRLTHLLETLPRGKKSLRLVPRYRSPDEVRDIFGQ